MELGYLRVANDGFVMGCCCGWQGKVLGAMAVGVAAEEKMKKKKRELMGVAATIAGGWEVDSAAKKGREVSIGAEELATDGWRGEMEARVDCRRWTIKAVGGSN